ncbi:MAG: Lrp/AsnC family transcriptional regulator [Candidatus Nanoarchaeia archaeon]|nr:Lrp/AsnC family transcriptional regulator [Candidatus Haiyanarchaeum thermophilum]MCW1307319.1 Lrp/AsnC family transcriptional regulator [Candidatus Haiyanarchaeum thermophilum]MCW1307935.1 Lrp/AsnC family transcriptional regulator [Candidatus Haiyanarchaeum thermophilum]
MRLDEKDIKILSLLRKNSRLSLTKIARKVDLPISTVYDRIRRLQRNGVIKKYTCLLDYRAIDYPIVARVLLKANSNKERVENLLANSIYTNTFEKINGDEFNYFSTFIAPSMEELQEFIERITEKLGIPNYKVFYVIREISEEKFLEDLEFLKFKLEPALKVGEQSSN